MGLGIFGAMLCVFCIVLFFYALSKRKTKRWWVIGASLGLVLFIVGVATSGDTVDEKEFITVNSNITADRLEAGMVHGDDFTIPFEYSRDWVKTVILSDVTKTDGVINYTIADGNSLTDYFAWVCYPQLVSSSQARVVFVEEESDNFIIIGVVRVDTDECLLRFGGTPGTNSNGW